MKRRIKDINVRASQRMKTRRLARNLSQEELAAICGLHRTYIGAIERAERNITLKTLSTIADALACPASELIADGDE